MKLKRTLVMQVFFLLLVVLPSVLALTPGARFGKALSYVFDLPDSPYFTLYLKFMYFILILSALQFGAQRGFKDAYTKPLKAFVIVVSLLAAIGTPTSIVLFIYEQFTAVVSVGLALIPTIVGYLLAQRLITGEDRFSAIMRSLIYILLVIVTFALSNHLANIGGPQNSLYDSLADVLYWAGIIALIGAIWNLLFAMVGGNPLAAAANAARGRTPNAPHGPNAPPGSNTPPGQAFSITRVTPNSAQQNAGVITLHVEGNGLDHPIRTLFFPFHTNHTLQPLNLVPNSIHNRTATSFDVDVNVSLDHQSNPTNLGHYDCHAEDNAGAHADLANCFEITAPGGGPPPGQPGNLPQALAALQQLQQLEGQVAGVFQNMGGLCRQVCTTHARNPNQNVDRERQQIQQFARDLEQHRQAFNQHLQTILNTSTLPQFTPQQRQDLTDAIHNISHTISLAHQFLVDYELHFLTGQAIP